MELKKISPTMHHITKFLNFYFLFIFILNKTWHKWSLFVKGIKQSFSNRWSSHHSKKQLTNKQIFISKITVPTLTNFYIKQNWDSTLLKRGYIFIKWEKITFKHFRIYMTNFNQTWHNSFLIHLLKRGTIIWRRVTEKIKNMYLYF